MKRKHRLIVDLTVSTPITERQAAKALQLMLDSLWPHRIWAADPAVYPKKFSVKEYSKVMAYQVAADIIVDDLLDKEDQK